MKNNFFIKILALIAGAILPFAFAPCEYYLLAIISPALLLYLWNRSTPPQALILGFIYGFGFFGIGISWVYISIHNYGDAPALFSGLITLLLILFMALFFAIQGFLLQKFFPNNTMRKFLLAFPASWVFLEWIRSWIFSGFPWLLLGNTQIDSSLRGFAPIIGVYGLSFLTAFCAGSLVGLIKVKKLSVKIMVALLLIVTWLIGSYLAKINWTLPTSKEINVSIIQGNIPQEEKWKTYQLESILKKYEELTKEQWNNQIIVWPEAAIPAFPQEVPKFLAQLTHEAKKHHATLITGIPFYDKSSGKYYNGILATGSHKAKYYKRHLVPFGEFLPFKKFLYWLHNFVIIPMAGFTNGDSNQPSFTLGDIIIAPFICYEIAFPDQVLDYFPHANLMLTLSDDSWFGKSSALAQHLQIARMRSLETGRYQLVSTNTGISAIIDSQGRIISKTKVFATTTLSGKISLMEGTTPWMGIGKHWWWVTMILSFFGSISWPRKKDYFPTNQINIHKKTY